LLSDARAVESAGRLELYVTAVPTPGGSPHDQAREIFTQVRQILSDNNARLLQERVFASQDAMAIIPSIRTEVYGALDDGVAPSWLLTPRTGIGEVAGVQVHALRTDSPILIVELAGRPTGRVVKWGDCRYVAVSGLVPSVNSSLDAAALSLLEDAESVLRRTGSEFGSLTRTWFWLGDILSWYDVFNRVRTGFFAERGMIGPQAGKEDLPASTGIGMWPNGGAACALDFIMVTGPGRLNTNLLAAGNQDSAFKYGSAFSRAAQAATPAGETVYVSGTAAIGADGLTQHAGDPEAQIRSTIANVRAVLTERDCADSDVVHAIAYCKTPEVERVWERLQAEIGWPFVTVIADICRDDLLFEVEATAVHGASRLAFLPLRDSFSGS